MATHPSRRPGANASGLFVWREETRERTSARGLRRPRVGEQGAAHWRRSCRRGRPCPISVRCTRFPSISSAAALPALRPPGSSPRPALPVVLHEMRPASMTPAHQTGGFAELVCSNSFRSDDAETNAVGLLHAEMRRAGSLIMRMGDAHKLPAGGALAVDRVGFSEAVTAALQAHPLIRIEPGEVDRAAAAGLGAVHRRHRPPHLLVPCRLDPGDDRTGAPRLLRRDRADRLSRDDRHGRRLVPVALRQGGARRHRRRLHQLPARPRPVPGLRRRAGLGRESRASTTGRRTRPISTAACRSR